MVRKISVAAFSILCFLFSFGYGQGISPGDSVLTETVVSLSTLVEPRRVPLNRPLVFTVRVSWEGDLDLIEIGGVEEPVLSNFDIVGTSSTNRVSGAPGGKKAVKEIAYTLQPKTLGMGYIEPVGLTYKNKATGETYSLMTQRIGVEVISPVPEPGERRMVWTWIVVGVIIVVGFFISLFLVRRKAGERQEEEEVERIVEEAYLEELKESVDLKGKEKRETFAILSKLFRKYLSEKFGISALEATTEELLKILAEEGLEDSLIRECEALLVKADVVKFSGQEATQAELEEAYTTVETILESHLAQTKEKLMQMEEEKSRKKKNLKIFGK